MFVFINSFFKYNVHLGHSLMNTVLLSSRLLFGFRKNVWFINIVKTLYFLRLGLKLVSFFIAYCFPVWFVHLDKFLKPYIDSLALRAGEFSCTSLWISGMLSNFRQIVYTYSLLRVKFSAKLSCKLKKFLSNFQYFFVSRFVWPRCLFVFSAFVNKPVIREAYNFCIPCLALVDTNSVSQGISLPLPSNDDSFEVLTYFGEIFSHQILVAKLNAVARWFVGVRSSKRLVTFSNWIDSFFKRSKKVSLVEALSKFYLYDSLKSFSFLSERISVSFSKSFHYVHYFFLLKFVSSSSSFFSRLRKYLQKKFFSRKNSIKPFVALIFLSRFFRTRRGKFILRRLFNNLNSKTGKSLYLLKFLFILSIRFSLVEYRYFPLFPQFFISLFFVKFLFPFFTNGLVGGTTHLKRKLKFR